MALNLSLSEILVNLERRIESLREQIGLHAWQEEHHREQRTLREAVAMLLICILALAS